MSDDSKNTPFGRAPATSSSEYALPPQPARETHAPQPAPQPAQHYDEPQERFIPQSPMDALQPEDIQPPKKRSSRARGTLVRFFNFLITLAFVGAVLFVGVVWYGKMEFDAPGPLAKDETFVVPKGATFSSIVPGLEAKGIIKQQGPLRIFTRGIRTAGKSSALKAGEFAFKPGMSMREVMIQLTEGRSIEYAITFPEGWTSIRMMERIAANETLTGDVPPVPPEGSLLPNTYSFQKGMTRDAFVQLLRDAQQKAVRDIWNSRVEGLPLKSAEEMVILASIVEKETGIASERPEVASVFINRLRKGMRLQTDPTVIYGIWGGKGKPKDRGGLRRSELAKPTPYNTYQIPGLPPGPIANPGLEALKAVANPAETDFLFFVADGTGGHVFSKTLPEHNANVKKWREIEAKRKAEAEAAAQQKAKEEQDAGTTDN